MNFSECLFQQIQKYHTKPSDILVLIFTLVIALATLVLITHDLNPDTKKFNLLTTWFGIVVLAPCLS